VILVAGIAWVIGFALLAGRLATQRGRSVPQWMLFGAIIGPLAAVLLRLAPLGHCPTCEADVRGWEQVCGWCGNDVTGDPSSGQPAVPSPASVTAEAPAAGPTVATVAGSAATTRSTARRRKAASASAGPAAAATTGTTAAASATTNGTRRRKGAAGATATIATATTTATATATPEPPAPEPPPPTPTPSAPTTVHWVASGVYLTGTGGLEPGARYSLELDGPKFIIRGPVDTDPNKISVACDVADLDASASGDRLVIDRPVVGRPSSFVLGFVGLAGGSSKSIAAQIMASAEQARRANT